MTAIKSNTSLVKAPDNSLANARKKALIKKLIIVCLLVAAVAAMMCCPAMAKGGGGDVAGKISDGLENFWGTLKMISIPVAIIGAVLMGYKLFFNGQKGMENAKADALKIILFIAIVLLAPRIIETIVGWFGTDGSWYTFSG